MDVPSLTRQLLAKQELTAEQVWAALHAMTQESSDRIAVAALLTAWRAKGETPNELSAACQWLRPRMVPVDTGGIEVLDTCGTGGDERGTFNVSTAAALVAAASGVPVVKHGNRSVSSKSGSADVLERLGVPVEMTAEKATACLRRYGFAFCFAPRFHPALAQVAEVRRRLGFRTIFNLLGPLMNPAGASRQLLGVGRPELLDLLAQTLARLGGVEALVVHGSDGLDEITLSGPTHVRKVIGGSVEATAWYPENFGLPRYPVEAFSVSGPEASAEMLLAALSGEKCPARDLVLANTAAALYLAGRVSRLTDGVRIAAETVDSGKALELLQALRRWSGPETSASVGE